LSRPKPPQAGPKASLYKGIDPSDNCRQGQWADPCAASTPGRRVESTASACEIHPLKIQKSQNFTTSSTNRGLTLCLPGGGLLSCGLRASSSVRRSSLCIGFNPYLEPPSGVMSLIQFSRLPVLMGELVSEDRYTQIAGLDALDHAELEHLHDLRDRRPSLRAALMCRRAPGAYMCV
jgi:hypothetical protein